MDFIKRQYGVGMGSLVGSTHLSLPFNLSDTTVLFPNTRMFGTSMDSLESTQNDSSAHKLSHGAVFHSLNTFGCYAFQAVQ
jgi:hypothetical protein